MSILATKYRDIALRIEAIEREYGDLDYDKCSLLKFNDESEWGYEIKIPITLHSTNSTHLNGITAAQVILKCTMGALDSMPPPPPPIPEDISILPGEIERLYQNVLEKSRRYESNDFFKELKIQAIELTNDEPTAEKLDIQFRSRMLIKRGTGAHLIPYLLTVANCISAEKALIKGEIGLAWDHIVSADQWTREEWIFSPRNTKQGELGGKARSDKYFEPIKQELIKKISELAPAEGWKSLPSAAKLLVDKLWTFVISKNLQNQAEELAIKENLQERSLDDARLTYGNFEQTLLRWMRTHEDVKAVYKQNAKKNTDTPD